MTIHVQHVIPVLVYTAAWTVQLLHLSVNHAVFILISHHHSIGSSTGLGHSLLLQVSMILALSSIWGMMDNHAQATLQEMNT